MNKSKLHLKIPKQTMHRKLFLYTFAMAILLLSLLATLLILLGRFRTPKDELFEKSDMQAQVFEREILTHRNTLAIMGVHLSDDAATIVGQYLTEHNMAFDELNDNSEALLEIQKLLFDPLREYFFQTGCSGAFVILNATVNSAAKEGTQSGLYLQVTGYERDRRRDAVLYRGIASVGRENGVMPHRKWRLETRRSFSPNGTRQPPTRGFRWNNPIGLPICLPFRVCQSAPYSLLCPSETRTAACSASAVLSFRKAIFRFSTVRYPS